MKAFLKIYDISDVVIILIDNMAGGAMKRNFIIYLVLGLLLVSCTFTDSILSKINENWVGNPEDALLSESTPVSGEANQNGILTKTPGSAGENQLIEGATSIYQIVKNKYITQTGTPLGMENFLHPSLACNWMGVAGQVFDINGQPQTGFVVQVGGELEGSNILLLAITGGNTSVGVGGFEIVLTDHVVASSHKLWIQLFNLDGKSLSDKVYFETYNDCDENLIVINLTETVIAYLFDYFLPVIMK